MQLSAVYLRSEKRFHLDIGEQNFRDLCLWIEEPFGEIHQELRRFKLHRIFQGDYLRELKVMSATSDEINEADFMEPSTIDIWHRYTDLEEGSEEQKESIKMKKRADKYIECYIKL